MAEHLISLIKIGILCAAVATFAARAENLVDPTRPPAGFGGAATAPVESAPRLQSILISSTRRIVIINGKTMKVGDKIGDAQLVAINENDVLLRTGKSLEVLRLYPSLVRRAADGKGGNNPDTPIKGK